jgi:hypothetical protein
VSKGGTPSGSFAKLLKAATEYVTGQESPDNPDVLKFVPQWRDEILGRPDPATRQGQARQEREAKMERARVVNEARRISEASTSTIGDIDGVLPRLAAVKTEAAAEVMAKLIRRRNDFAEPQKTNDGRWIRSLSVSGQPRSRY